MVGKKSICGIGHTISSVICDIRHHAIMYELTVKSLLCTIWSCHKAFEFQHYAHSRRSEQVNLHHCFAFFVCLDTTIIQSNPSNLTKQSILLQVWLISLIIVVFPMRNVSRYRNINSLWGGQIGNTISMFLFEIIIPFPCLYSSICCIQHAYLFFVRLWTINIVSLFIVDNTCPSHEEGNRVPEYKFALWISDRNHHLHVFVLEYVMRNYRLDVCMKYVAYSSFKQIK